MAAINVLLNFVRHATDRRNSGHTLPRCWPVAAAPAGFLLAVAASVLVSAVALCQNTGVAIRHHKIAEENPSFPAELTQAEAAIEQKDYTTA